MYERRRSYSYRDQKHQRNRMFKILFISLALFILFNCFITFFFSVWVVNSNTMNPELSSGDRVIFSSFSLPSFMMNKNEEQSFLFKRGSIVLIDMGRNKERNLPMKVIDTIVRFFTLQKISIFSGDGQYYMKRVIALPGDEISMTNYVFRVKPHNNPYSLTEFELSEKPYHLSIPQIPDIWDSSLPFSGNMDPIILGPNECFVVSDDRGNTNDSRTWGVISPSLITSKAVFRFWPVSKIKLL